MIIIDLSRNIIKRYVAVSTPEKVTSNSDTRYGTVVSEGEDLFVMIDGSSILTPVSSNIDLKEGDRVLVLVKDHEATVLGSPTAPTARLEELRDLEEGVTEFEVILADKVGTGELVAMQALIEDLEAKDVEISGKLQAATAEIETLTAENATINGKLDVYQADIEELQAETAKIESLEAEVAKIDDLEAKTAKIDILDADYADFKSATADNLSAINAEIENLDATYATISQLEVEQGRIDILETTSLTADSAEIKNLQADVADVDTLIFGSASGTTIQTSFANAVIAQLGNAQIKSAMIDSLSADKISAGDILTNNVRVLSEDGKLLISDETIQISDDTRVRVQIGKDASNDYSINVWDADGNLMFSQGGITDAAIKDAIIRDDMVSDTANIKASKLDISSLFAEINNSTETISSNKVLIDTDAGTLDVAFTKMSSDIDDISEEVTTQGTALSVVQGQISSKVWLEDIKETDLGEVEGAISTLETQYSELNQTVGGISATVGQHTTQIANKADSSTVTAVSDRVTEVEADLEGFRTEVSETYQTIDDMSGYSTTQQMNSAINQKASEITQSVSSTYATKTALSTTDTKAANAATAVSNAQKDVDAVEERMTSAETRISQTESDISLRATKTELTTVSNAASAAQSTANTAKTNAATAQSTADGVKTNLANNYYTKTQTDAQIKVSSDAITSSVTALETTLTEDYSTTAEMNTAIEQSAQGITSTVSATYATKAALSATDTKAANAATAASNAQKAADDAQDTADSAVTAASNAQSTANTAKTNAATAQSTAEAAQSTANTAKTNAATAQGTADIASNNADNAQNSIGEVDDRVTTAFSEIEQLVNAITNMVVDSNGRSTAVQTSEGWTFATSDIPNKLDDLNNLINNLSTIVGEWDINGNVVSNIKSLLSVVGDHGDTLNWVTIGEIDVDGDGSTEPCVELGESDSLYKVVITNKAIYFREGSKTPTLIQDNTLVTSNIRIDDEFRQGDFVWTIHNGNYGLIYRG